MGEAATLITPEVLRAIPLPMPEEGGDKEERGRVLVVGGGRETPGALMLAGVAALRAGAGKLQVATGAANAPLVASRLPEARVFALPETKEGRLKPSAAGALKEQFAGAQAVCIGPGMIEDESVARFVRGALRMCREVPLVLDAGAVACLSAGRGLLHELKGRAVVTPNGDELADIFGEDKEELTARPLEAARRAALEFRCVVALKGRETFIASPDGRAYVNRAGSVGLATSGSGDVLAGVIAGLVARGAEPLRAAAWGVYLHARAGERLSARLGTLGLLARELPGEIPPVMSELSNHERRARRVSREEREDNTVYKVVVNHEEQYSIWPADRENPLGWNDAGKQGLKQECLNYIKEVWTDMRPLSLRKKMQEMGYE